jgi:hypothetical protein
MCFAGGWINHNLNGSITEAQNRIILMSQTDDKSYTYAYIFYARIWGNIFGSFVDVNGSLPIHSEIIKESDYSYTNDSRLDANADGITDILITNNTAPPCDNKEPYRNDECYWNSIISIKEAHYMAECACNDRFQWNSTTNEFPEQNPQISIGGIISVSSPSIYL